MGKEEIIIKEVVHLGAPLSVVELHCEQETIKELPWSDEDFLISPFVFYKKESDQVYFYYDEKGTEWLTKQAGKYKGESKTIKKISSLFSRVGETLRTEKALERADFLKFLENVRNLWPWLNYMWWAIEYKDKNGGDVEDLMRVRKETEYFIPGLFAVFRNSTKLMYPEKKKYADVILLSEIENNQIPDESVLDKRLDGFAYANSRLYGSWQEMADEFNVSIEKPEINTNDNLKGQPAYAGLASGVVKIIEKREDMAKFNSGDVLVASTTTPDFLPVMKKSAAIVSEHGGVISHAAITSRELKIPCIVGVAGATQVLKDGMEVEVDANEGVVRILND